MRTSLVLIATLGLALSSQAQVSTQWTWFPNEQNQFARVDCTEETDIELQWFISGGTGASVDLVLAYQPDGICHPQAIIAGTTILERTQAIGNGVFAIEDVLSLDEFLPSGICDEPGLRQIGGSMCFYIYQLARRDSGGIIETEQVDINFDTVLPPVPEISELDARDQTIHFTIEAESDSGETFERVIQARACANGTLEAELPTELLVIEDDEDTEEDESNEIDAPSICDARSGFVEVTTSSQVFSLSGFSDDADYEFRVGLIDSFGNVGAMSEAQIIRPKPQDGTLAIYNGEGTPYGFRPDCSQSNLFAAPWMALLAFLALFRFRNRKTHLSTSTPLVGLLMVGLFAGGASAQDAILGDLVPPAQEERKFFAGGLNVDLWISPYLPNLDSETVGGVPVNPIYACVFEDKTLLELGGSGDYHLFDAFGSLQVGMGVAASRATGLSFPEGHFESDTDFECKASDATGQSQMTIVKLRPRLTYRFDYFLDKYRFPLVPYAQVGLVSTTYFLTRNGGFDEGSESIDPVGFVFGTEATLGLALALDILDPINFFTPNTIRRARARGTFQNAFFYAEAGYSQIDNFGAEGFVFSPRDDILKSGLPLQYRFGIGIEFQ